VRCVVSAAVLLLVQEMRKLRHHQARLSSWIQRSITAKLIADNHVVARSSEMSRNVATEERGIDIDVIANRYADIVMHVINMSIRNPYYP